MVKNISFEVSDNKLLLITGPVGCGKSSLLLSILNELPATEGTIERVGSIAYVPQTGWFSAARLTLLNFSVSLLFFGASLALFFSCSLSRFFIWPLG